MIISKILKIRNIFWKFEIYFENSKYILTFHILFFQKIYFEILLIYFENPKYILRISNIFWESKLYFENLKYILNKFHIFQKHSSQSNNILEFSFVQIKTIIEIYYSKSLWLFLSEQTRIPKCYSTVRNVFEKYGTCSKYIWDSQNIILILKIYLRFSKYIWDSQNIWVKSQNIFFEKIKYETSKYISNFQNIFRIFKIYFEFSKFLK